MKIIDKTPLLDAKGELSFAARLRGILKYGFNWYPELQAQQFVMARLSRQLERGFVLIRNYTLPGSEIVIPLILLGPPGIYVLYATPARGFFTANGADWKVGHGAAARGARVNLLMRVVRLARAFQVYLQRQQLALATLVEPILITADPGAHVESSRPAARVVQGDAISSFAQSLLQSRAMFEAPAVQDLADRIVNPRSAEELAALSAKPAEPVGAPSRARAIFQAAEVAAPVNPADLSFAFEDEVEPPPAGGGEALQADSAARPGRLLGMTRRQLGILLALVLLEVCVLIGFAALFFLTR
jgi:hypothetical protein